MVAQFQFDNFWNWFGKVLQRLRYQRHVCHMWKEGYFLCLVLLTQQDLFMV